MKSNITAVVPTRAGSERLKNKSTRSFANKSLLQIKLDVLVKLKEKNLIEDIVINTNCDKSMKIAEDNNIKVIERDSYYASSECPITEYWEDVLTRCVNTKSAMLCQVTSPLICLDTYIKCINIFNNTLNPIMTIDPIKDYLWKKDDKSIKSINYNYPDHPKSQDLSSQYFKINFGVVIISKDDLYKNNNIMTLNSTCISLDREESIDIDDEIDFKLAESIYLKNVL